LIPVGFPLRIPRNEWARTCVSLRSILPEPPPTGSLPGGEAYGSCLKRPGTSQCCTPVEVGRCPGLRQPANPRPASKRAKIGGSGAAEVNRWGRQFVYLALSRPHEVGTTGVAPHSGGSAPINPHAELASLHGDSA